MSEMIERVAKALWDFDQKEGGRAAFSNYIIFGNEWDNKIVPWEMATGPRAAVVTGNESRGRACATIKAMREPTEPMLYAEVAVYNELTGKKVTRVGRALWEAMIDSALMGGK